MVMETCGRQGSAALQDVADKNETLTPSVLTAHIGRNQHMIKRILKVIAIVLGILVIGAIVWNVFLWNALVAYALRAPSIYNRTGVYD